MLQTNKQNYSGIILAGLLSAIAFGMAYFCRYGVMSPLVHSVGESLATIAWLLAAGAIGMIAVLVVRAIRQ